MAAALSLNTGLVALISHWNTKTWENNVQIEYESYPLTLSYFIFWCHFIRCGCEHRQIKAVSQHFNLICTMEYTAHKIENIAVSYCSVHTYMYLLVLSIYWCSLNSYPQLKRIFINMKMTQMGFSEFLTVVVMCWAGVEEGREWLQPNSHYSSHQTGPPTGNHWWHQTLTYGNLGFDEHEVSSRLRPKFVYDTSGYGTEMAADLTSSL